jgi:catechol 2,3-dioxygenase-like lactoylglutathione lyase family enzyme
VAAVRAVEPDHVVLMSPDPEPLVDWYRRELGLEVLRLEEWRANQVPFVSLRVSPGFLVDVMRGERTGENVNHLALVVDDVDLDELAKSGRFEVEMGPADLFGARGVGRGLYVRDPDGNLVELRTYAND